MRSNDENVQVLAQNEKVITKGPSNHNIFHTVPFSEWIVTDLRGKYYNYIYNFLYLSTYDHCFLCVNAVNMYIVLSFLGYNIGRYRQRRQHFSRLQWRFFSASWHIRVRRHVCYLFVKKCYTKEYTYYCILNRTFVYFKRHTIAQKICYYYDYYYCIICHNFAVILFTHRDHEFPGQVHFITLITTYVPTTQTRWYNH